MPSYVETWDVSKPAGNRSLSLGDDDIRELKRALDERLNEDHVKPSDESGVTTVGYHRKATLIEQSSNPATVTDAGILYTKDVSGATELFYKDAAGNVLQLTSGGKIMGLGTDVYRTGDKLLSSNTTTPSGWVDQSATYTENFIRISSGVPLTTGGADTHNHGAATGSHTLTTGEIPSHTHTVTSNNDSNTGGGTTPFMSVGTANQTFLTQATGGGGGHTHSIASANNVPVYVQMKIYSKS